MAEPLNKGYLPSDSFAADGDASEAARKQSPAMPDKGNEGLLRRTTAELDDRVAELKRANEKVRESRRAALNLMEDAIQSREELRASEALLQKAFSIETVGVLFFGLNGRMTEANEAFVRMSGYTRDELLNTVHWEVFTPPEFMDVTLRAARELATRGETAPYEKQLIRKDGSRWWGVLAPTRLSGSGLDSQCVEFTLDITRLKELEDALRRANEELEERVRERTLELAEANVSLQVEVRDRRTAEQRVKMLLGQLVNAQEEERSRVARELHDTLGQQLAALRLGLAMFRTKAADQHELLAEIERMQKIFDRLDSDVDFLAWELRPAALDDLGLNAALRSFVREWSVHFGVTAEYHSFGFEDTRLSTAAETNLYRILQEALQNVHKHSGADHVSVQLDLRDGQAVLVVEDNGCGYEPDDAVGIDSGKGMGINNMRERAALIGGTFQLESKPGAGTTIYVRVSLDEHD
jgi:PAS domain S-box-containing protein